jgi:hypothetical protein
VRYRGEGGGVAAGLGARVGTGVRRPVGETLAAGVDPGDLVVIAMPAVSDVIEAQPVTTSARASSAERRRRLVVTPRMVVPEGQRVQAVRHRAVR